MSFAPRFTSIIETHNGQTCYLKTLIDSSFFSEKKWKNHRDESMSKMSKICRKFGSFEVVLHPNERHVQDSWYHHKGFFHPNPPASAQGRSFMFPCCFPNSGSPVPTKTGIQRLISPWTQIVWNGPKFIWLGDLSSMRITHQDVFDVFRNSREVGEVESSALQYSTTQVDVL